MLRRLLVATLVLLPAVGCGDDGADASQVTVFAAASLTDAFRALGDAYEASQDGTTVTFNFAASSALREQILGGAPADVFASANTANMDQIAEAGEVAGESVPFARNHLQIVVPAGNEAGVSGLADFADADLLVGLCAEEAPCGQFGREVLANAGVRPTIDTNEPDVRSLLTKIEAGELDAGIVYRTDALAAGDAVEGVGIPADQNVTATYPIAVLAASSDGAAARAFVDFVLSDAGQAILAEYGFDRA